MQIKIHWRYPIGIIGILVLFLLCSPETRSKDEFSLIGIPGGAAGLIARYVLDTMMGVNTIQGVHFQSHTLYDCCASASQYAMGSGHLDVAILCPDAARELVKKDSRFEIAGPVMLNSDVFITRLQADLHGPEIAVSQKRTFQRDMVVRRFGTESSAVPMFHGAVPFAFERGVVQGAVVDITKAFSLNGEISSAVVDGHDVRTYVLVNKKSLRNNIHFREFIASYTSTVREMDNEESLLRLMQAYVSADMTVGDVKKWKEMNVRFVCPFSFPLQE